MNIEKCYSSRMTKMNDAEEESKMTHLMLQANSGEIAK